MTSCNSAEAPATSSQTSTTPSAAATAAPGPRAYVTNEVSGDLTVIDLTSQSVVATIPLGKRPRGIQLSPDRTKLYVALSGSPIAAPGVDESKLPPAGKRFLGVVAAEAAGQTASGAPAAPQIQIVLNWFEELKTRVPTTK